MAAQGSIGSGRGGALGVIERLADGPAGPIRLALTLAIVSTPFAVVTIIDSSVDIDGHPTSVALGLAVVMGLVAVLVGAFVGGAIGGQVARRRPIGAPMLALATGWPAAIATIAVVPALLGQHYAAVRFCVDACGPAITSSRPTSAIEIYGFSVLLSSLVSVPAAILLTVAGWALGKRGHLIAKAVCWVAVVVALDIWSMAGAWAASVAMVVGVGIWAWAFWPSAEVSADESLTA